MLPSSPSASRRDLDSARPSSSSASAAGAPSSVRGTSDGDWAFTIALVVVALAARVLAALVFAREPVWDGHYYHFGAQRLASGLGYSEDVTIAGRVAWKAWTHYPVGYSGFLSLFYRVFGSGIGTAPVVGAAVGSAVVALVHRVGRYTTTTNRARVAGALAALHPGLILYSAVVMTELLGGLCLLGTAWAALAIRHPGARLVASGVLFGCGALVRPSSLLVLPALAFCTGRGFWQKVWHTAVIGLVGLLVILPWTVRNCRVMDGCALISTNGGWNLAIGALTDTGRFRTLRAADGCPVVTGQVQQDRCWAERGREIIAADPIAWLRKIPAKLSQTYDHESFAIEYLHEAAPELWPEARRQAGRRLLTFFHRLLVAAAALSPIALVTVYRPPSRSLAQWALTALTVAYASFSFFADEPAFYPLAALAPLLAYLPLPGRPPLSGALAFAHGAVLATTITHAAFFGEDRYHLVVTPVLCLLAAAALRAPRPLPIHRTARSQPA